MKSASLPVAQPKVNELRPFAKKYDRTGYAAESLWDNSVNQANPDRIIADLKREESAKALFLTSIGITPAEPVVIPKQSGIGFSDSPAFQELMESDQDLDPSYDNLEARRTLTDFITRAIDESYPNLKPELRQKLHEANRSQWIGEDGLILYSKGSHLRRAKDSIGQMELDTTATGEAIDKQLEGKEADFYEWLEAYVLEMFGPPRIKVRGRWEPYNLENIVAVMTKRGTRNKEAGMTFSEGSMRAAASKQFRNLEQMRKAAEKGIRPEEEVDEHRDKIAGRMSAWREAMVEFFRWDNTWDALDNSMEGMGRYLKGKRTRANFIAAMQAVDFQNLSPEAVTEGMALADQVITIPVPYFEAKPQRVVRLNEFEGAVVPHATSQHTLDILNKHGIPVETLPEGKTHDDTARAQAITNLSTPSFSLGNAYMPATNSTGTSSRPPALSPPQPQEGNRKPLVTLAAPCPFKAPSSWSLENIETHPHGSASYQTPSKGKQANTFPPQLSPKASTAWSPSPRMESPGKSLTSPPSTHPSPLTPSACPASPRT